MLPIKGLILRHFYVQIRLKKEQEEKERKKKEKAEAHLYTIIKVFDFEMIAINLFFLSL